MGEVIGFPTIDPADGRIGARLKHWRTARKIDLEALAEALAVSPESVRRIEAGRQHLTSAQLAAAIQTLHLPLWALVSDTPAH